MSTRIHLGSGRWVKERGRGGQGGRPERYTLPSPTSTQCTCCDQTLSLVGSNFVSLFFRKYYCLMMSLKTVLIFYFINASKYCFTVFIRLNTYVAFSELCRLQSCTEIFFNNPRINAALFWLGAAFTWGNAFHIWRLFESPLATSASTDF